MNIHLFLLVLISLIIQFVIIELIQRKFNLHAEITRKVLHISGGLTAIFWRYYLTKNEFILLLFLYLIILTCLRVYKFPKSLHVSYRKTYGEIAYMVGLVIISFGVYNNLTQFRLAVLLLVFPDMIAGLYNFYWQEKTKNIVHILIYFSISFIILILFLPIPLAIIMAAVLTITEFLSPFGSDNFTVPLVFVLLMKFLQP